MPDGWVARWGAPWVAAVICLSPTPSLGLEMTPIQVPLDAFGFQRVERREGVSVFADDHSKQPRVAGEGVLDASPDRVMAFLLDYESHARRMGRVVESRVLERGPDWMLVYQRLSLPVVTDRDYNLLVRWDQQAGVIRITYEAVTGRGLPPRPGVVRVTLHEGSWQLRNAMDGQTTFARFQMRMDLGGSVPTLLTRGSTGDEIPRMFGEMRKALREMN